MFRDFNSSHTTLLFPRFLTNSRTQRSSGREKMWKLTPSPPSRDRSVLTVALNPSAVDGTTINFSALSWAVRTQRQEARNQARKARVSAKPEMKMGVFLTRSPAGTQVVATWAEKVFPVGIPLIGPDMSSDMRTGAGSEEPAGSDRSKPLAVGVHGPHGGCGATVAAITAA
jgi:hypothetical protein